MTGKARNIGVIAGDLNGITVTDATLSLYTEIKPVLSRRLNHISVPYNVDYFLEHNITELGEKELNYLKTFDQLFLGAIGDPIRMKPGVIENGLLLRIRQAFNQYVNRRPIILPKGVDSPIVGKDHNHINFEICRENTEGLYVNRGAIYNQGTDEEYAIQEMHISYKALTQLTEYAVNLARERKRFDVPKVTFVFKKNVLTKAAPIWDRVEEESRERYPDIKFDYSHVDIFAMNMIDRPEIFDVIVTENLFGDIVTDLGAKLQGGIGTGVSGNINPTGIYPSMFEPLHGTAPDKWYKRDDSGLLIPGSFDPGLTQLIKPEATFRAYAMMLETMGELTAARIVEEAALNNMRHERYKEMRLDELTENAQNYVRHEVSKLK
ncbi:3-isopropylmalate dehydrogenase [Candidatus Woesearchaeota archaeon]|nr:3-isopropylmalate dehydrogenase [Candidatus Woesearchaeota archaeon]